MMHNRNIKFIFTILCMPLIGMDPPGHLLKLEHRKRKPEELFCRLPDPLRAKPIIQLTALAEQVDNHSCFHRMVYHAQCIRIAAERAKQGILFKESLKDLLSQTELLEQIYQMVNNYLNDRHSFYDRSRGVKDWQILGICNEKFSSLKGNSLVVEADTDGIFALSDPTISSNQSSLIDSSRLFRKYGSQPSLDKYRIELDQSSALHLQLKKLEKPWQPCHFICLIPHHAFLATAISDNVEAVLYVVDSSNSNAGTLRPMNQLVSKLLVYVEAHNNKNKKSKAS